MKEPRRTLEIILRIRFPSTHIQGSEQNFETNKVKETFLTELNLKLLKKNFKILEYDFWTLRAFINVLQEAEEGAL